MSEKKCSGLHCRCMEKDCPNVHFADCAEHNPNVKPLPRMKIRHIVEKYIDYGYGDWEGIPIKDIPQMLSEIIAEQNK